MLYITNREYLYQFRKLKYQIDSQIEELQNLRSMMISIKSLSFDSDKIQSSPDDKLTGLISNALDLEKEIYENSNRLINIQRETRTAIEQSETNSEQEKLLLRNYFINGFSWNQCANIMNISERHIHRLKKKAIENFKCH